MSVLLIDLSNVNTVTPQAFPLMRAAGVVGAWLKASEGGSFDDQKFPLYEQLAERSSIRVGAYHYARPDRNTPREEAQHFLRRYRGHDDRRALKAVLDMEAPQAAHLGRRLIVWAREWNHHVRDELGHWPLFYSYPDYITRTMGMTPADKPIGGGLWLAAYGRNDGQDHHGPPPPPWKRVHAHQFTSNAHMPGIVGTVDLSHAPLWGPLLAHPVRGRL